MGRVIVQVPAAAAVVRVTVPLVVPRKLMAPVVPEAVPIVMVEAKVGAVPKTTRPVPVSSERTPANWEELVEAKAERLSEVVVRVSETSGRVIVLVPDVEAPVILKLLVPGVAEVPAK